MESGKYFTLCSYRTQCHSTLRYFPLSSLAFILVASVLDQFFFRLHCSLLLVSSLHHHYFSVIFILLQPLYYIHCVPPIKRKRNENRSFAKRAWQQRGYGNLRQLNSSTRMLHERIGFFSLCFAKKLIRSFTFVLQKCERMREKTNFRYTHSSGAQIHWRRHKMTSEKT